MKYFTFIYHKFDRLIVRFSVIKQDPGGFVKHLKAIQKSFESHNNDTKLIWSVDEVN